MDVETLRCNLEESRRANSSLAARVIAESTRADRAESEAAAAVASYADPDVGLSADAARSVPLLRKLAEAQVTIKALRMRASAVEAEMARKESAAGGAAGAVLRAAAAWPHHPNDSNASNTGNATNINLFAKTLEQLETAQREASTAGARDAASRASLVAAQIVIKAARDDADAARRELAALSTDDAEPSTREAFESAVEGHRARAATEIVAAKKAAATAAAAAREEAAAATARLKSEVDALAATVRAAHAARGLAAAALEAVTAATEADIRLRLDTQGPPPPLPPGTIADAFADAFLLKREATLARARVAGLEAGAATREAAWQTAAVEHALAWQGQLLASSARTAEAEAARDFAEMLAADERVDAANRVGAARGEATKFRIALRASETARIGAVDAAASLSELVVRHETAGTAREAELFALRVTYATAVNCRDNALERAAKAEEVIATVADTAKALDVFSSDAARARAAEAAAHAAITAKDINFAALAENIHAHLKSAVLEANADAVMARANGAKADAAANVSAAACIAADRRVVEAEAATVRARAAGARAQAVLVRARLGMARGRRTASMPPVFPAAEEPFDAATIVVCAARMRARIVKMSLGASPDVHAATSRTAVVGEGEEDGIAENDGVTDTNAANTDVDAGRRRKKNIETAIRRRVAARNARGGVPLMWSVDPNTRFTLKSVGGGDDARSTSPGAASGTPDEPPMPPRSRKRGIERGGGGLPNTPPSPRHGPRPRIVVRHSPRPSPRIINSPATVARHSPTLPPPPSSAHTRILPRRRSRNCHLHLAKTPETPRRRARPPRRRRCDFSWHAVVEARCCLCTTRGHAPRTLGALC